MHNPLRKSDNPLNLRLNNLKKDFVNLKAIPGYNHFKTHGYNYMKGSFQ